MLSLKYIKGFNAIRAFAAIGVVIHHIELYRTRDGFSSLFDLPVIHRFVDNLGGGMVNLFFVLSGFLITYLLLQEQDNTGTIDVKKFYLRRVFRIWPLYYLVLFFAFIVVPSIAANTNFLDPNTYYFKLISSTDYSSVWPYFIFFLSNIALVKSIIVVSASHTWSVSFEEQFYAIWPWLIKYFSKNLKYALVTIIFVKYILIVSNLYANVDFLGLNILLALPFEKMALGALMCVLVVEENRFWKKLLTGIWSLRMSLILMLISLFLPYRHLQVVFYTLALGTIFLNQVNIKEHRIVNELGKISYGIYMYHPILMYFSYEVINRLNISNSIIYVLIIYVTTLSLTFLVSYLSFYYYESYFLKLKTKFAKV